MTVTELTSPCGLFCDDCLPGNERFFRDLARFRESLDRFGFPEYAALKAEANPVFHEYPAFDNLLGEIAGLRCPQPCRLGGGKPYCRVRECVAERNLPGCWDCLERQGCSLLDHLRRFHELDRNLDMIATHGTEDWVDHRGTHYRWLKKDE